MLPFLRAGTSLSQTTRILTAASIASAPTTLPTGRLSASTPTQGEFAVVAPLCSGGVLPERLVQAVCGQESLA
jgi:hypothetical protein